MADCFTNHIGQGEYHEPVVGSGAICDLHFTAPDAFPSFWSASESSTMLNTFDNPRPFTTTGSITLTSTFSVPTFSVTDGIVEVEISNFAAGAGPYRDMVLSVLDGGDNLLYEVLEPITSSGVFGAIIPLEIPEYSGIIKIRISMMPSITIPLPEYMFIDDINFPQCVGGGGGGGH